MSYAIGWIPGAPNHDDTQLCARCQHHGSAHHNPTSCSVRGHWLRHCRCGGYTIQSGSPALAGEVVEGSLDQAAGPAQIG
jgi:hypothetical protein